MNDDDDYTHASSLFLNADSHFFWHDELAGDRMVDSTRKLVEQNGVRCVFGRRVEELSVLAYGAVILSRLAELER